ncbi:hypothetical protein ACOSP7_009841 [Xanthoceras sorbifolium]
MKKRRLLSQTRESLAWKDLFMRYLWNGELLDERLEVWRVVRKTPRYVIHHNQLYRRGFSHPLLRCIDASKATQDYSTSRNGRNTVLTCILNRSSPPYRNYN